MKPSTGVAQPKKLSKQSKTHSFFNSSSFFLSRKEEPFFSGEQPSGHQAFFGGKILQPKSSNDHFSQISRKEENPGFSGEKAPTSVILPSLRQGIIQRNGEEEEETAAISIPQSIADEIVQSRIRRELEAFNNILINVQGTTADVSGEEGEGGVIQLPPITTVAVRAAYFINTETARRHYRGRRRSGGRRSFNTVVRALRDSSFIRTRTGRGRRRRVTARTIGRAVQLGKATPQEIRAFVQAAVDSGVIARFARRRRLLPRRQSLGDLDPAQIQNIVQTWIYRMGLGVDCSGFVLQVVQRARQDLQDLASTYNERFAGGMFGLPRVQEPGDVTPGDLVERTAHSYSRYPRVRVPTELRIGDVWLMNCRRRRQRRPRRCLRWGHIRILSDVRQVSQDGEDKIEFETAESTGGSTRPRAGQVGRTWRTHSLTVLHPIMRYPPPPEGGRRRRRRRRRRGVRSSRFHRPF